MNGFDSVAVFSLLAIIQHQRSTNVHKVLMIHFSSRLDINVRTSAKIYSSNQVVFIAQIDSVC